MSDLLLQKVTAEMSLDELKLLLTALYTFEHQIKNKATRPNVLIAIYEVEKFYNFDFDIQQLISVYPTFAGRQLGLLCDKLYDAFHDMDTS